MIREMRLVIRVNWRSEHTHRSVVQLVECHGSDSTEISSLGKKVHADLLVKSTTNDSRRK